MKHSEISLWKGGLLVVLAINGDKEIVKGMRTSASATVTRSWVQACRDRGIHEASWRSARISPRRADPPRRASEQNTRRMSHCHWEQRSDGGERERERVRTLALMNSSMRPLGKRPRRRGPWPWRDMHSKVRTSSARSKKTSTPWP